MPFEDDDEVQIVYCNIVEKQSPIITIFDEKTLKIKSSKFKERINKPNLYGNTALHEALTNPKCNVREIALLLLHGAELEYKNNVGDTPLSFAVYYNVNVQVVKLLLDNGANVNATNNFRDTPLHRALDKHNTDLKVVRLLLDYKADMNKFNFRGDAPLHYCLSNNPDINVVRLLLNHGADVRIEDKDRNTLLHVALDREYNLEVIKLLMEKGIPINSKNIDGDTPLQFALRNIVCRPDIIKLLLDNEADCNLPNKYNYYPLQTALKNVASTRAVFQMLLYYGARVNESDLEGNTPLHTACISFTNCNVETVKLLLKKGADINALNIKGETPITFAVKCLSCKLDVIQLLLECGASLQIPDVGGNTPFHSAIDITNGTVSILKLMLNYGADVDHKNDRGQTPLCTALSNRKLCMPVVKFLLNNGADVNSVDEDGSTPLHYALSNPICTIEIASLLLEKKAGLNTVNNSMETPMSCALSFHGNMKLVKFLLEKRGLINFHGSTEIVSLESLIEYYNSDRGVAAKGFIKLMIKYSLLEDFCFGVEDLLLKSFDCADFLDFSGRCRTEVGQMPSEYITRGLTLWGLICDRKNPMEEKWLEMDWDIKHLLDILASNKYPIYSDVIAATIKRDTMITKLKDNVVHTVSRDFSAQSVLNYHSACYLSEQLSNESLLNLLLAFHKSRKYSLKRRKAPKNYDVCFKRPKTRVKEKRSKLRMLKKGISV